MRIVGKVRFVIPDLASMHALFSNVLIMQLVQPLFMISDVLACLDIREMAETIATDVSVMNFDMILVARFLLWLVKFVTFCMKLHKKFCKDMSSNSRAISLNLSMFTLLK